MTATSNGNSAARLGIGGTSKNSFSLIGSSSTSHHPGRRSLQGFFFFSTLVTCKSRGEMSAPRGTRVTLSPTAGLLLNSEMLVILISFHGGRNLPCSSFLSDILQTTPSPTV